MLGLIKQYWWVIAIAIFFIKIKGKDGSKKSIAKTIVDEIDGMISK